MAGKGKIQENIRSTDRAGVLSLSLGLIVLTAGIAFLVGMTAQTTSISFAVMKNTVIGLAGVLPMFLPLWLIWLGVQLCVSAKRAVSFRQVMLSGLFYLCLLAFLTIITSVKGNGSLMDYVQNINLNFVRHPSPGSMGAYLSSAFTRYAGRIDPLPGGGLLGMLLAYPFWRMLGIAGAVTLLLFLQLLLLAGIIRLNPVMVSDWFSARFNRLPASSHDERAVPEEVAQAEPVQQMMPEAGMEQRPAQPAAQPLYKPVRKVPAAYEQPPMEEAPYYPQVSPNAFTAHDTGESMGFEAVRGDMESIYRQYEEPEIEQEPAPIVETRRRRAETVRPAEPAHPAETVRPAEPVHPAEPVYPAEPVRPAEPEYIEAYEEAIEEAPVFNEPAPTVYEAPAPVRRSAPPAPAPVTEHKAAAAPHTAHAGALPEEADLPWEGDDVWEDEENFAEEPVRPAAPVHRPSGIVREVHTDAAVPLTGKRVAIPQPPKPLNAASLDGTAHTGPTHRQIEFPHDDYEKPPVRLMSELPPDVTEDHTEEDNRRADKLLQTLNSFSIAAEVQQIVHGPAITRFAIRLGEGVNVNRLRNVMDNLSVELLAKSPVRAEIPIPGTPLIGIEVSNEKATTVFLRDVLTSSKMADNKSPTTVALGKDITGAPIIMDLMDMPHLLIAGATGSGKSVCINSIITSLLYRASPQDVRLILVDPKFVELQPYNGCPHLLLPVITDDKKVVAALEWLCEEMDERYRKMQKYNVRNVDGYNRRIGLDEEKLPKIIMVIDEMADLIATCGKAVEEHIKRITAKARAAGICLVLATQRPSVNVITGVIKANIPSRIAFQVSSQVDSRTILDAVGAEKLLGYGDMLYMPRTNPAPTRVQGCFISDKDVESVTEYVKSRNQPNYNADIMEYLERTERETEREEFGGDMEGVEVFDELLPDAIEMAVEAGQMSISMLQRVLRVGYGRAGRLIDEMDRRGIISGNEGTKPRKTLISREEYNRMVEMGDPKIANLSG